MQESHPPRSPEKSLHRTQGNQQASYQRCCNNIHTRDAFPICSLDEIAGYRAKNGTAEWVRLMCSLFSDNVQFWAGIFWRGCQTAVPPDTLPVHAWAESEPSFWNQLEDFVTVTLTKQQRGCTSLTPSSPALQILVSLDKNITYVQKEQKLQCECTTKEHISTGSVLLYDLWLICSKQNIRYLYVC